jgi:hypothetical protein
MKNLEKRLTKLEKREAEKTHGEINKAWEISWTRRFVIAFITYISAFSFMKISSMEPAILGAFVPVGGFILSTLSMTSLKKIWIKYQK